MVVQALKSGASLSNGLLPDSDLVKRAPAANEAQRRHHYRSGGPEAFGRTVMLETRLQS